MKRKRKTYPLSQTFAENAQPRKDGSKLRDTFYWSKTVRGFGLACWKGGKKTLVVQKGNERITLGSFPEMSVAEGESRAMEELLKMRKGVSAKAARKNGPTVDSAFNDYMRHNVNLRPMTVDLYRRTFETFVSPLPDVAKKYPGLAAVALPRDLSLFDLGREPKRVLDLFAYLTNEIPPQRRKGEQGAKSVANGAMKLIRAVYRREAEINDNLTTQPGTATLDPAPPATAP